MRRQSILQSRFIKFENSWKALNPSDHILRSLKRTSFQVAFVYPFVFLARQISPLSVCLSVCLPACHPFSIALVSPILSIVYTEMEDQ